MIRGSLAQLHKSRAGGLGLRIDNWIWFYLNWANNANFPAASFMAPNMRQIIDDFANRTGISITWLIEEESSKHLLPQERLEWITEDKRQIEWLQSYLAKQFPGTFFSPPPRLLGRNLIVTNIDIWQTDLSNKARMVEQMKLSWDLHRQSDVIFKWFREKDERSRCEVAEKWLSEKKYAPQWKAFTIASYEDLLIFFDTQYLNDAEKKLIVAEIKKRASQLQYRKKMTDKKQCNLVLSNKAILDLEKLAAKYGVSRPQIIEALIQFEMERNSYLPEKVKSITWS